MSERLISKKKPIFEISEQLQAYLERYKRITKIPIFYEDLLRFSGSVAVLDQNDEDTLWVRVYYNEYEREEIDHNLKSIYSILYSDGDMDIFPFLSVDAVDYCTFANSRPFRVKIRNILNDNFTYFYVKKADASRIYGLELEHVFSPYHLSYLVFQDTLIEEHIAGIPGDVFIKDFLPKCTVSQKSQIAKEFVKFNERCMIRLLGDMRAYNYVIVPIHDFDHVVYRIRSIDFDQQSYEGKFKVYRPQFFKENNTLVQLVSERLQEYSVEQYRKEERSAIAKRMISSQKRIKGLLKCMMKDKISSLDKVKELRKDLYKFTNDIKFRRCRSMGHILRVALEFVKRHYEDVNMKRFVK